MNENETQRSGRRRRGGRRRSKDRGERAETRSAPQQKQPTSLWQKIISFFTGKPKSGGAPQATPARKYPTYEPRQPRENRENRDEERKPLYESSAEPRVSRKPEAVEVTTPKLYVGNLSFDTTEADLLELFNGIGGVQSAEIVTHKESEKSKGFGFVMMTTVDEAKRAVIELHDKDFMGRKLVVSGAKTPPGR
jgi:hypothetical protein